MRLTKRDRDGLEILDEKAPDPIYVDKVIPLIEAVKGDLDINVGLMDLRSLNRLTIVVNGNRIIRSVSGIVDLPPSVIVKGDGHLTLIGFEGANIEIYANTHLESCNFESVSASAPLSAYSSKIAGLNVSENGVFTECSIGEIDVLSGRVTFKNCLMTLSGTNNVYEGVVRFNQCVFMGPVRRWFTIWRGNKYLFIPEKWLPNAVFSPGDLHVYQTDCTFNNVRNNLHQVCYPDAER